MPLFLSFDGLCEPKNPGGVATYGFLVQRDGKLLHEECGLAAEPWTPQATNNVAEYMGLKKGLEWLLGQKLQAERLEVRGDSKLVISQVTGAWKAKTPHIAQLVREVRALAAEFPAISFHWVPREQNREADALTNRAYAEYRLPAARKTRTAFGGRPVEFRLAASVPCPATPAAVYRALTGGALKVWAGEGAVLEARKGGEVWIPAAGASGNGTVEEVEEGRRIVWVTPHGMRMRIELTRAGRETEVALEATTRAARLILPLDPGFPQTAATFLDAWSEILERLVRVSAPPEKL